jgi:hypothetical protein
VLRRVHHQDTAGHRPGPAPGRRVGQPGLVHEQGEEEHRRRPAGVAQRRVRPGRKVLPRPVRLPPPQPGVQSPGEDGGVVGLRRAVQRQRHAPVGGAFDGGGEAGEEGAAGQGGGVLAEGRDAVAAEVEGALADGPVCPEPPGAGGPRRAVGCQKGAQVREEVVGGGLGGLACRWL